LVKWENTKRDTADFLKENSPRLLSFLVNAYADFLVNAFVLVNAAAFMCCCVLVNALPEHT